MKNKKGFTLIELLIIIAIIALLATVILANVVQSKKRARINSAKTSLKGVLSSIIACKDGGGTVIAPAGGANVCATNVGLSGSKWPDLPSGYAYAGGSHNASNCVFQVSTNGDSPAPLTCDCVKQACL